MNRYSDREEQVYGRIVQMTYLAECRGVKIDLKSMDKNIYVAHRHLYGILLKHYQEMLMKRQISDDNYRRNKEKKEDGFVWHQRQTYTLADFSGAARSDLDFDIKLFPTTCSDNPGEEFYKYHEK
jgi:hypothetical protein